VGLMKYDSYWDELKRTDWFSKILLVFPYLLGLSVFVMFFMEWIKTGPV